MVSHRSSRVKASQITPESAPSVQHENLRLVDQCTTQRSRWRIPPDSSDGRLSSNPRQPDKPQQVAGTGFRGLIGAEIIRHDFPAAASRALRMLRRSSRPGTWPAMPTVERGEVTSSPLEPDAALIGRLPVATSRGDGRDRASGLDRRWHRSCSGTLSVRLVQHPEDARYPVLKVWARPSPTTIRDRCRCQRRLSFMPLI